MPRVTTRTLRPAPGAVMSAAEPAEAAAPAAPEEEEEELDYDALSFTDPRYWAHFYDEEDLDFYEARGRGDDARSSGGCGRMLCFCVR